MASYRNNSSLLNVPSPNETPIPQPDIDIIAPQLPSTQLPNADLQDILLSGVQLPDIQLPSTQLPEADKSNVLLPNAQVNVLVPAMVVEPFHNPPDTSISMVAHDLQAKNLPSGRCFMCQRSKDTKVQTTCFSCSTLVCKKHSKHIVLCVHCEGSFTF